MKFGPLAVPGEMLSSRLRKWLNRCGVQFTLFVFAFLAVSAGASARQTCNEHIVQMYEAKQSSALLTFYRSRTSTCSKNTVLLALFSLQPATFAGLFVRDFPTSTTSVQEIGLESTVALHKAVSYPFAALSHIAQGRNADAAYKLINASAHADGAVAEVAAPIMATAFVRDPQTMFTGFDRLKAFVRARVIGDRYAWCGRDREVRTMLPMIARSDLPSYREIMRTAKTSCLR